MARASKQKLRPKPSPRDVRLALLHFMQLAAAYCGYGRLQLGFGASASEPARLQRLRKVTDLLLADREAQRAEQRGAIFQKLLAEVADAYRVYQEDQRQTREQLRERLIAIIEVLGVEPTERDLSTLVLKRSTIRTRGGSVAAATHALAKAIGRAPRTLNKVRSRGAAQLPIVRLSFRRWVTRRERDRFARNLPTWENVILGIGAACQGLESLFDLDERNACAIEAAHDRSFRIFTTPSGIRAALKDPDPPLAWRELRPALERAVDERWRAVRKTLETCLDSVEGPLAAATVPDVRSLDHSSSLDEVGGLFENRYRPALEALAAERLTPGPEATARADQAVRAAVLEDEIEARAKAWEAVLAETEGLEPRRARRTTRRRAFMLEGDGLGVMRDAVFLHYPSEAALKSALSRELRLHGVLFDLVEGEDGTDVVCRARERSVRVVDTWIMDADEDSPDPVIPKNAPRAKTGTLTDKEIARISAAVSAYLRGR